MGASTSCLSSRSLNSHFRTQHKTHKHSNAFAMSSSSSTTASSSSPPPQDKPRILITGGKGKGRGRGGRGRKAQAHHSARAGTCGINLHPSLPWSVCYASSFLRRSSALWSSLLSPQPGPPSPPSPPSPPLPNRLRLPAPDQPSPSTCRCRRGKL